MAEYALGVFRLLGRFPRQIVLYAGRPPLKMPCELHGQDLLFRYRVMDIREFDGEGLLESEGIGDNAIATLGQIAGP